MRSESQLLLERVKLLRKYFAEGQMQPYEAAEALIRALGEVDREPFWMPLEDQLLQKPQGLEMVAFRIDDLKASQELVYLFNQLQIAYCTLLHQRLQRQAEMEITRELVDELKLQAAVNMLASGLEKDHGAMRKRVSRLRLVS